MAYAFFVNLTIIISFLVLRGQMLREDYLSKLGSWQKELLLGVSTGVLGCLLMLSSLQVADGTVVDLRYVAIIIAALYGGTTAIFTTVSVIAVFRVAYFGISMSSLVAVFGALIMGVGSMLINYLDFSQRKRYLALSLYNFVVMVAGFLLLLQERNCLPRVLVNFFLMSGLGLIIIYIVYKYIEKSHQSYQELKYYQLMANNLSDLLTRHQRDGTYLYLSPACESLLGYAPEELVGSNAFELFHSQDKRRIQNDYLQLLKDNEQSTLTYRLKTKNGEYKWVETTAQAVRNETDEIEEIVCVTRDITNRKQAEIDLKDTNQQLTILSYQDGLTQIPNRRYFEQQLEKEWQRLARSSEPLSLLMVDIDYFKEYNDTYGHQQGDQCLKKVAATLEEVIKRPADEVMRYGGEEFAVILPETDEAGAVEVGERLRKEIEELKIANVNAGVEDKAESEVEDKFKSKSKSYLTVSVGIATIIPTAVGDKELLIEQADKALYRAKENGRNQVLIY